MTRSGGGVIARTNARRRAASRSSETGVPERVPQRSLLHPPAANPLGSRGRWGGDPVVTGAAHRHSLLWTAEPPAGEERGRSEHDDLAAAWRNGAATTSFPRPPPSRRSRMTPGGAIGHTDSPPDFPRPWTLPRA